jgi:hypothetical protein
MSIENLATCPSANGQSDVTNPLQLSGFELRIAAIPEVSFFVKDVTLPSISLPQVQQDTPFVMIPRVGDRVEFSQLTARIMVDEEMKNYRALYDWITKVGFKGNWKEVNEWRTRRGDVRGITSDKDLLLTSDATLVIKGANMKTAARIIIKDMWLTDLGSITLTDESTETQYLYCDATFALREFHFDD